MTKINRRTFAGRQLVGMFMLATLTIASAGVARAWEIIPSIGVTKSTDTNADDAQALGGLAVRVPLLSFLQAEGGIGYRQDSFGDGALAVRQWPVTASLWATPLPMLYAGGGIGWYRTTYDFDSALPIEDNTEMEMGVHLGGGVNVPIASNLGLDLNGRYIFMQDGDDLDDLQLPTEFNPNFWTTSLGLAIRF